MRGIEDIEKKLARVTDKYGLITDRLALAAERYQPVMDKIVLTTEQCLFLGRKMALPAGALVFIVITSLSADQELVNASGKDATPRPIPPTATSTASLPATPTVDIPATVRAALPPSPTVDIPATVRAALPPPPPQPPPAATPFVVKPEVVKPEVVKPEVVKVPDPYLLPVPVTPPPDPDYIRIRRDDFNDIVDDIVEKALAKERERLTTELRQKCEVEKATAVDITRQKTEERIRTEIAAKGWSFDIWSALLGALAGLGIGSATAYRYRDRIIHHFHSHPHPHP